MHTSDLAHGVLTVQGYTGAAERQGAHCNPSYYILKKRKKKQKNKKRQRKIIITLSKNFSRCLKSPIPFTQINVLKQTISSKQDVVEQLSANRTKSTLPAERDAIAEPKGKDTFS